LNLDEYIEPHTPKEGIVLADSGYDNRKIENAIVNRKWTFIIALAKTINVKSENKYLNIPKSKGWIQIAGFFKNYCRAGWQTIRIFMNGANRK